MTEPEHQKAASSSGCATVAVVVGVLWMLLSGLCTVTYALPALFSNYSYLGIFGLGIGALSLGVGWLILHAGRSGQQSERKDRGPT